jgi:hypothetical protein
MTCSMLLQVKTAPQFHRHKSSLDGLQAYCMDCEKTYLRTYAAGRQAYTPSEVPLLKLCTKCGEVSRHLTAGPAFTTCHVKGCHDLCAPSLAIGGAATEFPVRTQEKPPEMFHVVRKAGHGLQARCKLCRMVDVSKRRQKNATQGP